MTTHATPPSTEALERSVSSAPPSTGTSAPSRSAIAALVALVAVATGIFLAFDALPFQDLPAHAGLIALRDRYATATFEQQHYVYAPHVGPYSLFRFLGAALTRLFGPVGAVRALATLPLVATPCAMLFARRRLYGDRSLTFGFLGVALSFGIMTLLGFASYLLGVAVMLVALTLWLELMAAVDGGAALAYRSRRLELMVGSAALLLFVAHGHAFVLFLVLAGLATLATGDRLARIWRIRALMPAIALAAYVAWLEHGTTTPEGSVPIVPSFSPRFQAAYDKFTLLITPTLMTRSGVDFFLGVVLWLLALLVVFWTARDLRKAGATDAVSAADVADRERRHSIALLTGAAALFLTFLALPHAIGWFGFVDGRLVPLVLMLVFLAVRRPALPSPLRTALDAAIPLTATALVVTALVASYRFQAEASGYREVLGRVPAGARLLNLPVDPNSDVFTAHPFIHYDKLVLCERGVVVSDVWFHQGSALYPTPVNPQLALPDSYSESDLRYVDWPAYHLEDWTHVLIRTRPGASMPDVPPSLALDAHQGGWWLFRTESQHAQKAPDAHQGLR